MQSEVSREPSSSNRSSLQNLQRINVTVIKEHHPTVANAELYAARRDTGILGEASVI